MVESLSHRIASQIAGSEFTTLPVSTVRACKRSILDGMGTLLAGSGTVESEAFVDLARAMGGNTGATILGYGERTSPTLAAFCNGAFAHALDFEDAFDPVPLHPNASLLPAVFALSQYSGAVSGRELITAVAAGCDLVCRIGLSVRRPLEASGWYPPPILGAFGAVAAGARLLRLAPEQVLDAFSILLLQNSCPGEIKHSARTVLRAVREAFPAQAAVQAVLLASRGVRGFEQPFEGVNGFFGLYAHGEYDAQQLLDTLHDNHIERLSFKKWPCCRGTHAFIECVQYLRRQHQVEVGEIDRIELTGASVHRMLVEPSARKRQPDTLIDAKFSLPFTVALACVRGEITLDSFNEACLRDVRVLELAQRCVFTEATPQERYGAASGSVCIALRTGGRLSHRVQDAVGDPGNPLSDAQLCEKFVDCAGRSRRPLTRVRATAMAELLMTLEHRTDVGALIDAF